MFNTRVLYSCTEQWGNRIVKREQVHTARALPVMPNAQASHPRGIAGPLMELQRDRGTTTAG